jgi:hypothetical protein
MTSVDKPQSRQSLIPTCQTIPPCSLRQGVGPRHARASRCAWLRSRLRRPCLPLRVAVMRTHGRDEEHGSIASGGVEQGTWVRQGMRGGQEAAFRETFRAFAGAERPNCLQGSQAEPSTKKRPALRRADRPHFVHGLSVPGFRAGIVSYFLLIFTHFVPRIPGGFGRAGPPEGCR